MKIDYLHIQSQFKNLNDIKIDFDETNLMTVIVGGNGSGKSNVIEALVSIFRNLDLGEPPLFDYTLKYRLGRGDEQKWITVIAKFDAKGLSKQYVIKVAHSNKDEGVHVSISKVKRDSRGNSDYLPKHVFAYYSGPSDRLENYFKQHRTNFYRNLLYKKIDLGADIRPLFYAKPYHSQFVLLAFFLSEKNTDEKKFLQQHLGIEALDSVHFVMRKPGWAQPKNKKELFWGADGVVREFLDALYPYCLAPVKVTRNEDIKLTSGNIQNEFLHLFLPDVETLRKFAKDLSADTFFKMLESTLLSEIISEVRVRVKISSSEIPLSFSELSEGEQQLLTVLGLLKFTGGKDSLFLLDEPDTHLNPAWTVKYLEFLRQFVPDEKTSQLLMISHHPLAIAELEKEQVQVMKRDGKEVAALMPSESPKGMGINLLLRSDIFGLKTTLDNSTNQDVTKRNQLASKERLTKSEEQELQDLNNKLEKLGFSISTDDPDYMDFLMQKYHQPNIKGK